MIKIFLPSDFFEDGIVDEIYNTLSKTIYEFLDDKSLINSVVFQHNQEIIYLNTVDKIKSFLLSKDFYQYKFCSTSYFFRELFRLPGNLLIKNIFDNKSKSNNLSHFLSEFDIDKYQNEFKKLKGYKQSQTISDLKKAATNDVLEIKELKLIMQAFDYDNLNIADRHTILTKMDVSVCPYCNMNYTINYSSNNALRTTADLDHFYIKSAYPEFGLCLYNFIPSCSVCNSKLKGKKNMSRETHIYPHETSFNGKASFEITNLIDILVHKQSPLQLNLVMHKDDKKTKQSIDTFKINEIYEFHRNFANDLVNKALIYNDSYINELQLLFAKTNETLDIRTHIFGPKTTEQEYAKKSLGKLTADLLKQLGIYK